MQTSRNEGASGTSGTSGIAGIAGIAYIIATGLGLFYAHSYYGHFGVEFLNFAAPLDLLFIFFAYLHNMLPLVVVELALIPVIAAAIVVVLIGISLIALGILALGGLLISLAVKGVVKNLLKCLVRFLTFLVKAVVSFLTPFKSSGRANCKGCGSRWDGKGTAPVGMFPADRWGLHEFFGNAWEWVQDCYTPGYSSAPRDGSAWELAGCAQRVHRGGSWATRPERLRAALRNSDNAAFRSSKVGFRVAQTIHPSAASGSSRRVASVPAPTRRTESYPTRTDRSSSDSDYRLTFRASPKYPKAAERENIQGHVVLQFTVTAAGTVRDPIVVDSAPPSIFNAAAIEAVRKFRYSPRIVNGRPVEVRGVRTRFRFQLSD